MNARKLSVTLVALALAWPGADAVAQEQELQFGAYAGYMVYTGLGHVTTSTGATSPLEAKNGFVWGLNAAWFFNDNWGVRANWYMSPTDLQRSGEKVAGMNVFQGDVALLYRWPKGKFEPYAALGVGLAVYDPDGDAIVNGLLRDGTISTAFAPSLGIGTNIILSDRFLLTLEVADAITFKNIDEAQFLPNLTYTSYTAHQFRFVGGIAIRTGL